MRRSALVLNVLRAGGWIGVAGWVGLAVGRGRFWDASADRLRDPDASANPDVHAVVPARNEADVIGRTVGSLLAQRYAGRFTITIVDDASEDGTAEVARAAIAAHACTHAARVVAGRPRPDGWTGKVWALHAGLETARAAGAAPAFWWFTDADVEHDAGTLARLVATAQHDRRDLVSQMVELHCDSAWERLLIPAFVFFFRMLYPFAWTADARRTSAGAAGGCVLLRAELLDRIGGIACIGGELIDDCSLAAAVKRAGGRLHLSLSTRSRSIRPYASLEPIWSMVARTAYTQLRRSPLLLAGTLAGMLLLYVAPPAAAVAGAAARRKDVALPGVLAWGTMSALYLPTVRLYRLAPWRALLLPAAGILYAAMTVDSARRHAGGRGGTWKGRGFSAEGRRPQR